MSAILITAYSYAAALIGAGFASGQEILCYFNRFGKIGAAGILTAALLITLFAWLILDVCVKHRISDFEAFSQLICGGHFGTILKGGIFLFSFVSFSVMLSAFGTVCHALTGIPCALSALCCTAVFAVLLRRQCERLFSANGIIGMLLCAGIMICCLYMLRYREFHTASLPLKATASAFTYSGYNLISAAPLLSVLSHRLKRRRDALCAALISGMAILLMLALIFSLQGIYMNKISLGELPMLTLAARQSHGFALIYGTILIFAIITTLVSSGGAMAQILMPQQSGIRLYLILAGAYLLSGFSFSSLVNTLYRICGVAGAVIVLIITVKCILLKR